MIYLRVGKRALQSMGALAFLVLAIQIGDSPAGAAGESHPARFPAELSGENRLVTRDDVPSGEGIATPRELNRKVREAAAIASGYPRVGGQDWGGGSPEWYAKYDLNVLGIGQVDRDFVQEVKALNPHSRVIFTSDINAGVHLGSDQTSSPSGWYTSTTAGSCDPLARSNCVTIYNDSYFFHNYSNLGGRGTFDPNYPNLLYNEYVPMWYATVKDELIRVADGVASDGFWGGWLPSEWRGIVDLNGDGVHEPNYDTLLDEGADALLRALRQRIGPDKLIVINGGAYDPVINGVFVEHFGGLTANRWSVLMGTYEQWMGELSEPHAILLDGKVYDYEGYGGNVPTPSRNFFSFMRYTLGLALQGDAYFSFSDVEAGEHYWRKYYDEFDVDLGMPSPQAPKPQPIPGTCRNVPLTPTESEERCVWARFFEKGLSLVNPTGVTVTVTAEQLRGLKGYDPGPDDLYHRFRGGQDPSVNDGSAFTSVALWGATFSSGGEEEALGDGILLVKDPHTVITDIYIDNWGSGTSPGSPSPAENKAEALIGFTQATSCDQGQDYYTVRCAIYGDPNSGSPYATYLSPPYATAPGGSNAKAVYAPKLGVPGHYEVFEWHGRLDNATLASNVRFTISHADGATIRVVNQQANPGQWNSLGTFRFEVGSQGKVIISASDADGMVMADAIKFVWRGDDGRPTPSFADVPPSHWAFSPIEALYRAGYVVGCNLAPRLFCPQQTLTRAQAAVLIDRGHHGADVIPEMPATPPFSDVPLSHWAVDWVDLLKRDGLTAGCSTSESLFCPEAPNTRAETTVFLLRIKHGRDYLPEQPGQQVFLDVAPSDWFADWVTAAYREGLTEGCDEPERLKLSHFRPLEPITRAEAACMMYYALISQGAAP